VAYNPTHQVTTNGIGNFAGNHGFFSGCFSGNMGFSCIFSLFFPSTKKKTLDPQHARATVPEIQDGGLRLFDLGSIWLQRELFPSRVKA